MGNFYLYYYGFNRPSFRQFDYGGTGEYTVDVIDTWEMAVTNQGVFKGKFTITLPGKEYMAIRVRKI